jgi:hypothetical protein
MVALPMIFIHSLNVNIQRNPKKQLQPPNCNCLASPYMCREANALVVQGSGL